MQQVNTEVFNWKYWENFKNNIGKDYEKLILIGNEDKIRELKKLNISKENKVKIIETRGMSEVAELIKGANLVVSPDTSIVH